MENENLEKEIWLVASGDLRIAANQQCWAAQADMEEKLGAAVERKGYRIKRAHGYDPQEKHGFIHSQKMGIEVFKRIPHQARVIVAESVWQYSHHVLPGLLTHRGPVLTVANWSGQWPGLVGLLNLNGSLTKAGVSYSTLWSEDFGDYFFEDGLEEWLETGTIRHDQEHVKDYALVKTPLEDEKAGRTFGRLFREHKAIMGVFDEGCMGMYNAIIPDHLLNPTGVFKERLSQSALYAGICSVTDDESEAVLGWLLERGMQFHWGDDEASQLTRRQSLEQCKMYIAALRIADAFGCDAIGIQYQQGLKDLTAASDLVEGLLNNNERPPVYGTAGVELYPGRALPHFNEVDECAGLDALLTYRLWQELGMDGANTLHDIRWGEDFKGDDYIDGFVWLFMISGAIPAAHLKEGYQEAMSERQPPMFFPKGGGTLKGVSKEGNFVWSRIFIMDGKLHCDLGVGEAVYLPAEETKRRWNATNPEWPVMHALLPGISRNQMMSRHKSNHIHVVYATDEPTAHKACRIKAAALAELGIEVHFCGSIDYAGNIFE